MLLSRLLVAVSQVSGGGFVESEASVLLMIVFVERVCATIKRSRKLIWDWIGAPTLELGWVAPASRSCQLDAHRKSDGQSNRSTLFEKGTLQLHIMDIGTYGKRVTSPIGIL